MNLLQLQFARNCPPASVLTDQKKVRPCNLRKICPFCWGRYYVFETWNHAYPAIFTGRNKLSPHNREVVLLESGIVYDSLENLVLGTHLDREREQTLLKQHCKVHGVMRFEAFFVSPQDPRRLVLRRSTLAMTEGYNNELQDLHGLTRHSKYQNINKKQLSNIVAVAAHYPPALLRADAVQTKKVLEATKGIRTISFRGCMRKPSEH
jgi:hypothetical protein